VKRELQERYVRELFRAPVSVTAVRDEREAWDLHVADALTALPLLTPAPAEFIDVGSGGGSPGIPLAIELGSPFTLLEATGTKARFLERVLVDLDLPGRVVGARSEELARGAGRDAYQVATARALAPPTVAVELCLPLVRPGGRLILWTGEVNAGELQSVAQQLGGVLGEVNNTAPGRSLVVVEKLEPTPERFPRRPGMARKRPLVSLPSDP